MQHANLQPLLANHVPVQANHGPPQTQTTEQRIDQLIIAIDNGVDTIDQHQEKSRLTGKNAACSAIFGKLGNLGGAVVQALPNFDTWGQVSEAEMGELFKVMCLGIDLPFSEGDLPGFRGRPRIL